jgi:hypothetical protein
MSELQNNQHPRRPRWIENFWEALFDVLDMSTTQKLNDIIALAIFQSLHTQHPRDLVRFQFLNRISAEGDRLALLALRSVSGHQHTSILDPMRFADNVSHDIIGMVAGLFHITDEHALLPILKHGHLLGHLIPQAQRRQGREDVHFTGFPFQGRRSMHDQTRKDLSTCRQTYMRN